MWLAAQSNGNVSGPTMLIVLITGGVIYSFGYARARMHQANRDYKDNKAKRPILRKAFWSMWWLAVKVGFWVVLGFICLVAWVIHDVRS